MAKISGLVASGKINTGNADAGAVRAMPAAPEVPALDSNATQINIQESAKENGATETLPQSEALDSNASKGGLAEPVVVSAPLSSGSCFEELPVSAVFPSRYQVRTTADDDYIETLMSSIQESGVISPIVVRVLCRAGALGSNGYELVAGHHRFEACRRLGHTHVFAIVKHMSDAAAAMALASDNAVHKAMHDFERFKTAKMLKDNGFCKSNAEVGVALGVSRTLISFLMSFDAFPVGAKAILEINPGILGATQANDLKDLAVDEPDIFTEALLLLSKGGLQQNQIRTWIERRFKSSRVRMKNRRVLEITRPGLTSRIKVTYNDSEAKIQSPGLNVEKLQKLIEDNLDELIS